MKKSFLFTAILMASVIFASCKKDEPQLDNFKTYTLSRATGYGNDWVYFSFAAGKEVSGITEENRNQRLDWDIAFNRNNMRTNSGLSGKGKGGALDTGKEKLAEVTAAPESGYTADSEIEITENTSTMPPPKIKTSGNTVLANAFKFSGPPPTYTPSNKVYIVKNAEGKAVKVQFIGFHNETGISGFVKFKYKEL